MALEELKNEFREVELKAQATLERSIANKNNLQIEEGDDQNLQYPRFTKYEKEAGVEGQQKESLENIIEVHHDSIFTDQLFEDEDIDYQRDQSRYLNEAQDENMNNSLHSAKGSNKGDKQGPANESNFEKKLASMDEEQDPKTQTQLVKRKTLVIEENVTFNDEEIKALESREKRNMLYHLCYRIARNSNFVAFILLVILANTIVLFLDKYPIDEEQENDMELTNRIFFVVFVVEMLIKIIGFGFKNYLRDNFNKFDLLVIVFSTVDIMLTILDFNSVQNALKAFRALRFLRIFKIARQWRSFQVILKKMQKSFKDMLNFMILLSLFIVIYALLGMELYANQVKFDEFNNPVECYVSNLEECEQKGISLRANFDRLDVAMQSVFTLIVGDGWSEIMAQHIRATSQWSSLYFISLVTFGNIIMLNLFQAILLRQFEEKQGDEASKSEYVKLWDTVYGKSMSYTQTFYNWVKSSKLCCCLFSSSQKSDLMDEKSLIENHEAEVFNDDSKAEIFGKSIYEKQQDVSESRQGEFQSNSKTRDIEGNISLFHTMKDPVIHIIDNNSKNMQVLDPTLDNTARELIEDKFQSIESKEENQRSPLVYTERVKESNNIEIFKEEGKKNDNDQSLIMLNQQMEKINLQQNQEKDLKPTKPIKQIQNSRRKSLSLAASRAQSASQNNEKIFQGCSLLIFNEKSIIRKISYMIYSNKVFQSAIFIIIIMSTVNLAMQDPLSDPDSEFNVTLDKIDLAFSIVFAVECILKIVSKGFLFNGEKSYLRKTWNQLDLVVVVLSLVSFISTENIKLTKILRNFRVVRPLRLIPKNQGLKIAVQSLMNSIKGIINVTIMAFFIMFVWGIFGVNFFKGLYYNCYQNHLIGNSQFNALNGQVQDKYSCITSGGEWIKRKNTFDNVFYAAFTLFQISTGEGWIDTMQQTTDALGIDLTKSQNVSPFSALYFIMFLLVGGLFTLNLFQGVVISTYLNEKEKLSNNHLLTEMQREWMKVQIKCQKIKPKITIPKVNFEFRRTLIYFSNNRKFEFFIFFCIILNTIVLACNWYGMPAKVEESFNYLNHVFTVIFSFEAIIKIIGYGFVYFKKFWNLFDFFILICTIFQVVNSIVSFKTEIILYATVLRVLKLLKMTRLLHKGQGFKNIIKTLILTLPQLGNIALLLFLLLVFYAITGMNVFGRVKLHGELTFQANFQSFSNALLTVIRCSTGEAWNDIMVALMDQQSVLYQCIDYPTYADIEANGGQAIACGSYWPSLIFFLSFQLLVCQIFLNLFIAIILDGFDDSKQEQELRIDDQMIKVFKEAWAVQDPEGKGFLDLRQLENIFEDLIISKTKWVKGGEVLLMNQKLLYKMIRYLELPMYNQYKQFNFNDVLCRLADAIFQVDFEKFLIDQHDTIEIAEKHAKKQPLIKQLTMQGTKSEFSEQHRVGQSQDGTDMKDLYSAHQTAAAIAEQHNQAMLKWMEKGDHLRFESYHEFKFNLNEKLRDKTVKIALNEELKAQKLYRMTQNLLKGQVRDFCDSRILYVRPILQKLVSQALQRRRHLKQTMKDSPEKKIVETMNAQAAAERQDQVMEKLYKQREDFFQILAKTLKEEEKREKERQEFEKAQLSNISRKNQNVSMKTFTSGVNAEEYTPQTTKKGEKSKNKFPTGVKEKVKKLPLPDMNYENHQLDNQISKNVEKPYKEQFKRIEKSETIDKVLENTILRDYEELIIKDKQNNIQ